MARVCFCFGFHHGEGWFEVEFVKEIDGVSIFLCVTERERGEIEVR